MSPFSQSLRNAMTAALWAARKLALGTIASGVPSLAAKALAPIDRRRALLLGGIISQFRKRNDDHADFWAEAVGLYPDDPSVLRMRIHSALRSGDTEVAEAQLALLIASRQTRAEDSRFVVGLTNIDLHNSRAGRIRSRVRRFLASLRGSREYRIASVRLSRLIFAHFPRAGTRASGSIRSRFLCMMDRSQVCSEPKRLLHRVSACEARIERGCAGSMLDTDVSVAQCRAFVSLVRNRIFARRPFSFVRLGDGEAACLAYEPPLAMFATLDARERERIWWGAALEYRVRAKMYPRLARAIFDADCIGVPTVSRFLRELRLLRNDTLETSLTGRGLRAVLHSVEKWENLRSSGLPPPVFVSCHLHQDLELWNCYAELFDGMNDVVLVSCHANLGDCMQQKFGVRLAGHVVLPPDRVTGPYLARKPDGPSLPSLFDEAIDRLGDLPRNRLVLVGAGLLGKLLVTEARARGGVALDIGSIFDHWLGLKTRSYLDLNAA